MVQATYLDCDIAYKESRMTGVHEYIDECSVMSVSVVCEPNKSWTYVNSGRVVCHVRFVSTINVLQKEEKYCKQYITASNEFKAVASCRSSRLGRAIDRHSMWIGGMGHDIRMREPFAPGVSALTPYTQIDESSCKSSRCEEATSQKRPCQDGK